MLGETREEGRKYDESKPDWSLLDLQIMEEVVRVLTSGARKYSPANWKLVPNGKNRYFAAAMRHITAWQQGQKTDMETGESHLSHAMCCLLFLRGIEKQERESRLPGYAGDVVACHPSVAEVAIAMGIEPGFTPAEELARPFPGHPQCGWESPWFGKILGVCNLPAGHPGGHLTITGQNPAP
jgi:hypothetical protein